MIRNYLLTALRNAARYRGYTLLNVFGLCVGITSSMLILLWLNDEVQMDKFHSNGDKIYQLYRVMRQSGGVANTTESLPKPLADHIRETYSEVDAVSQISWEMNVEFQLDENIVESAGRFASQSFLDEFTITWITGDRQSALEDIQGVALAKSTAIALFGDQWESAVGKQVRVDDQYDFNVTGVFDDYGRNSSLQFAWLAPAETYFTQNDWVDDWGNGSFGIFISVNDPGKVDQVRERIFDEINTHTVDNPNAGDEVVIFQKFEDTYLYSKFENGTIVGGRIDQVRLLGIIAVLTLLIACINFMNLATARAARRSKEVGIRKAIGARAKAVSMQFYVEAGLTSSIAVLLSILLVIVSLPYFNELVGKQLFLDFALPTTWLFIVSILLFVSLFSGSYPALMLARFNVVTALKGSVKPSSFTAVFRKGLVVFQFSISTLLIICTAVIFMQLDFVLNKDLGLNKDNMVMVRLNEDLSRRLSSYKEEIRKIPQVKDITAASGNPLNYGRSTSSAVWEGKDPSEGYEINVILADNEFVDVMEMNVVEGRGFRDQISDSTNFLVNQVAAELMGFDDPLNKDLSFWGIEGKIVGVVKDFHMRDFYTPIAPLIISCYSTNNMQYALIRIEGDTRQAIESIEATTTKLLPEEEFTFEFLDQSIAAAYENEIVVRSLAGILAAISILISCLGLFGLASYSAERRAKEIGVRKVQGATNGQIIMLLSKDYSTLILISFMVAFPLAYLVSGNWLENFEYRTELNPWLFVLGGLVVFAIGVTTVILKSIQAAASNPVETLKDE